MKISFSIQAWEEYLSLQRQDKKTLKKINELIKKLCIKIIYTLNSINILKYETTTTSFLQQSHLFNSYFSSTKPNSFAL